MLDVSNIADVFLTFLTDKKVHKIAPVKTIAGCVILVAMSQEESVVPFQVCRQKPGVCQIF